MESPFAIFVELGRTLVLTREYLTCCFMICGEPELETFAERESPKESS